MPNCGTNVLLVCSTLVFMPFWNTKLCHVRPLKYQILSCMPFGKSKLYYLCPFEIPHCGTHVYLIHQSLVPWPFWNTEQWYLCPFGVPNFALLKYQTSPLTPFWNTTLWYLCPFDVPKFVLRPLWNAKLWYLCPSGVPNFGIYALLKYHNLKLTLFLNAKLWSLMPFWCAKLLVIFKNFLFGQIRNLLKKDYWVTNTWRGWDLLILNFSM